METRTSKNKLNAQMDSELENKIEEYLFDFKRYNVDFKPKYRNNPTLIKEYLLSNIEFDNFNVSLQGSSDSLGSYIMIYCTVYEERDYNETHILSIESKLENIIYNLIN